MNKLVIPIIVLNKSSTRSMKKFITTHWKKLVFLIALVGAFGYGRLGSTSSTPATPAPVVKTEDAPAPAETATAVTQTTEQAPAAVAPAVVKTEEAVIRDGIRESLRLEFGTVNRTVEMKSLPTVKWESAGGDPNLRFPIDPSGELVLGISSTEPPAIIDPEPGYRWVKIEKAGDAPAKWKGAVKDTGRVFGIVPAVLAKQGK